MRDEKGNSTRAVKRMVSSQLAKLERQAGVAPGNRALPTKTGALMRALRAKSAPGVVSLPGATLLVTAEWVERPVRVLVFKCQRCLGVVVAPEWESDAARKLLHVLRAKGYGAALWTCDCGQDCLVTVGDQVNPDFRARHPSALLAKAVMETRPAQAVVYECPGCHFEHLLPAEPVGRKASERDSTRFAVARSLLQGKSNQRRCIRCKVGLYVGPVPV